MEVRSFEDLECWKRCRDLRRKISDRVKKFPQDEKYKLIDQITRAARSVTANIAEGYGRFHYQEYVQFCRQGRGSLYELVDHLIVAADENYITEKELTAYKLDIKNCIVVLNGFIKYLSRTKQRDGVQEPEGRHGTNND